ncbi:MAG: aminoacyl-tRNA hydrolase [Candidatus Aminicenantes bacterium]|nr:aminoacyl-tRNA hydrolase [Candidatus Aminicenantes bacterium]
MGNPDKKYEKTPHNAGFLCIDELCRRHDLQLAGLGKLMQYKKTTIGGQSVVLAKPMTYMNESGLALQKLKKIFAFDPAQMLVIYDDIDLPLGHIRIRERGSAGTHKGMKSVIQHCGTQEFPRLRIGIQNPGRKISNLVNYVLTSFRGEKNEIFKLGIMQAADAAEAILETGMANAMNAFNRRKNSLLLPEGRG